jgi:hypothetical protein
MADTSIADDVRTEPPEMDYRSHRRQFERYLHLLKWFVIHMLLILPMLYFFLVGHQLVTGTMFLILALAALAYGVVSMGSIARDVEAGFESAGHPGSARR